MNCRVCGSEAIVIRTSKSARLDVRKRACPKCLESWETTERETPGTRRRDDSATTVRLVARMSQTGRGPVAVASQPPLGDLGGLSSQVSLSVVNPAPSEPLSQTQARVRRQRVYVEPKYTPDFEQLWNGCQRVGAKSEAFVAWGQVGKPDPSGAAETWRRYRESIGDQHPKHVASWLRSFGHKQEWLPQQAIQSPARPPVKSFVQQAEDARAAAHLEERAERIFNRRLPL